MSYADSHNTSKQVQVSLAIIIPQPLHVTLEGKNFKNTPQCTKGVFTWHLDDFRPGASSLWFPYMDLYYFVYMIPPQISCWHESPRPEFTPVLVPGRELHSGNEISQQYHVNVVVRFYPWFKFYFPLFESHYHILPYPQTKENKNLNQG